jgi:hypothetical protein
MAKRTCQRSNGTLCAVARSMLNHTISKWDKTITAELQPFTIQHAATIYNTTKRRSQDYDTSPWEQFTGERSKLDQNDMHSLFCPVYVLDRRMQESTSPPKWTKRTTQKVYFGHLHHYSKSVPMIWDPQTKLVSPQFHVMFDDTFDTVQGPDSNVKHTETMDRLFKTNSYKYDDPFGNEHPYLFSYGGVDIHPDNLTPNIKTGQESLAMPSTHDNHHSATQTNSMSFSVLRIGSSALQHWLKAMYSASVELYAISVCSLLDHCIDTPANTMINHVRDKHESRRCANY